jgi:hypothetical protein
MISSRQRRTRRAAEPQRTRGRCAVGPQVHISVRLRTRAGARGVLCRACPGTDGPRARTVLALGRSRHATRMCARVLEHAVSYRYLLAHPAKTQATFSAQVCVFADRRLASGVCVYRSV